MGTRGAIHPEISAMNDIEYAPFECLVYFAAAKRHVGQARLAISHESREMAFEEGRAGFADLIKTAYSIAKVPSRQPIEMAAYPRYLQDLRMAFSGEAFFDAFRALAQYFSGNTDGETLEADKLQELESFLTLLGARVYEQTGLPVCERM